MNASQTSIRPQLRTIDGLKIRCRRQRWPAGAGAAADEPVAGEPLRVRADVGDARRARPIVRGRPPGVRRVGGREDLCRLERWASSSRADRRGRSGQAARRRAGRRDIRRSVRCVGTSAADRRLSSSDRRSRGAARPRRAAQVVGARPRPRQVPPDRPARDRRRRGDTIAGGVPDDVRADYVASLRRRPLRRVDALRPEVSRGAARRWPSSCHGSRRPSRSSTVATTASSRSRTPSSSPNGCPTAVSRSSTPATSSGKRHRRSTPRSSSTRSRPRRHDERLVSTSADRTPGRSRPSRVVGRAGAVRPRSSLLR